MKKIIPFVKELEFDPGISEVTSIALEHNLKMENDDSVVGEFIISGKYKPNNVSINEEVFEKNIPFDITLDDKYDSKKVEIDIDDFYYEIISDNLLRVHIDVLVGNLIYVKKEEKEPVCTLKDDNDLREIKINNEKERDPITVDETEILMEEDDKKEENVVSQIGIKFENDNYVTYKVHIIRESETLDDIIQKYDISKEEIEKYNDVSNITLGSKIVIPTLNE